MTWYRTANKNVILFSKNLYHFQTFQFNTVLTHTACHLHTFHYTGSIRRVTQRTRSSLTVMLTMRLLSYTMKAMTLNNTLETFSFGCTNYFYFVTFSEDVKSNSVTNIFVDGIVAKFFCKF